MLTFTVFSQGSFFAPLSLLLREEGLLTRNFGCSVRSISLFLSVWVSVFCLNLSLFTLFFLPPCFPAGCWQEDTFLAVPCFTRAFFACRYFAISSAFCHAVTLSEEVVSGDWGRGARWIWQFIFERRVNSVQRHKRKPPPPSAAHADKNLINQGVGWGWWHPRACTMETLGAIHCL